MSPKSSANPTKTVFTCINPECLQQFSLPGFRIAVFLYGVIFLVGRNDSYVGIVCPKCSNISLQKFQSTEFSKILNMLGNRIYQISKKEKSDDLFKVSANEYWGIINEKNISDCQPYLGGLLSQLEYNTFEHDPNYLLNSFNSPLKHKYIISSNENYGYKGPKNFSIRSAIIKVDEIKKLTQFDLKEKIGGQKYYISYVMGTRVNGTQLKLFGFKEKEIPELLKIENEHKKKIFPRHIYQSQIRESCDKFCNNKHIKRIIKSIKPIDLFEYKKKGGDIENILKAGNEKEQISISNEFMDLLKDDDVSLSIKPKGIRLLSKNSHLFKDIDFSKSLSDVDLSPYIHTLQDQEKIYVDMYEQVWNKYKTDAMQIKLIKEALDFAILYRQSVKKIDWSDSSIWRFKRDYLNSLFKYSHRIHGNKLIPEEIVSLIEEARPEIELIYNAVKINKLSGHEPGLDKKWMKEALEKFDGNPESFKVIERSFLESSELYFFSHGQEKRDFAGGILKKIAEKRKLTITGAQNLFKIYKALTD